MGTTYDKASKIDPAIQPTIRQMIERYHPELAEVEAIIGCFFAFAEKDEHGEPKAPAVTLGGYPCAATVKINSYRDRVEGKADATITIDHDQWMTLDHDSQKALIDHELEHLEVARDDNGTPKYDDLGRPKLKIRKHDHQFGWFNSIAKRHGDASYEVRQAKAFADEQGQTYFGWAKPPQQGVEAMPAKVPAMKVVG